MRTALLRAAAVITVAVTPAAAQRAAGPSLPVVSRAERVSSVAPDLLPHRNTGNVVTIDVASMRTPAIAPARGIQIS
jgi:hypothetical protein